MLSAQLSSGGSETQTASFPRGEAAHHEPRILIPEVVDVPLPKEPTEEITLPASINGRDLSEGKP